MIADELKKLIRKIPDFPQKGILFYDITTLLADATGYRRAIDALAARYIEKRPDLIVGVEARGFLLAAALAYTLGRGVALIRKPGKLPSATDRISYDLEYGSNEIEIHKDAIKKGASILLVDDLLATGGTIEAAARLVENRGAGDIELLFLVELTFLGARDRLADYTIHSLIKYD